MATAATTSGRRYQRHDQTAPRGLGPGIEANTPFGVNRIEGLIYTEVDRYDALTPIRNGRLD